jgi:hypothetical protein
LTLTKAALCGAALQEGKLAPARLVGGQAILPSSTEGSGLSIVKVVEIETSRMLSWVTMMPSSARISSTSRMLRLNT